MSAMRSYRLLIEWQLLRLKSFIPLAMVVQGLFAVGIVAGYPLLFPELDRLTMLFLATGAPAITLITVGLVAVPQVVSQAKTQGSLEFMRTLPIPRMVFLLADLSVWLVIVLPGLAFALIVGWLRFDLAFEVSPLVIPAFVLVALASSAVGYAMACVLPPMVAVLITQVMVVFVMLFSPLNFPAERLPVWLQSVHQVLPIQAMGEAIRGTLAGSTFPLSVQPFLMLAAWCAGGLGIAYLTLRRRA